MPRIKHLHQWRNVGTFSGSGTHGGISACECGRTMRFGYDSKGLLPRQMPRKFTFLERP